MAYALSLLLLWQPLLAAADGVTPTAGGVDKAANGVPVVNIRNPNGAGVSHNFYQDLNVGRQGMILNNGRGLSQTELAGYIEGNPNLKNGSARLILNEVIGANPSALNGYLEVGGARADVVIANPNGITCNGCGFINTDHATLTTGRALMDADGALRAFDVQGGRIHIGADGANTGNVDRFDLIARSVSLAGAINADQLNVIAGRQRVDPRTLATEGLSEESLDGEIPAFAIDAAALGGMYANRIRLVGNEKGVGVRLDAPVAAQNGDLTLSANGRLSFSALSASDSVQLAAADVTANGHLVAGDRIDVQADAWRAVAGTTSAEVVEMALDSVRLDAGAGWLGVDRLTVHADSIDNAGELAGNTLSIRATDRLDNRGAIVAGGEARVETGHLDNEGTLAANGDLRITAGTVRQDGAATAGGELRIDASGLESTARSETVADGTLRVRADDVTQRGLMHGGERLDVEASSVSHLDGRMQSAGEVRVKADSLENRALISGAGSVEIETGTLDNRGTVVAEQSLTVAVDDNLNNTGDLQGLSDVTVTAGSLDNDGNLLAVGDLTVGTDGRLENRGSLQAEGALAVDAGDALINTGDLLTNADLSARSAGLFQQTGRLIAGGDAALSGAELVNGGLVSVVERLLLGHGEITNHGTLEAGGLLSVSEQVAVLDNAGVLRSDGDLRMAAQRVHNRDGGAVTAVGHVVAEGVDRLTNQGLIMARGDLALRVRELLNERAADAGARQGTLGAAGQVLIEGERLLNRNGALIGSGGAMTLRVIDTLDNDRADIVANGDLLIAADEALAKTGRVNNHSGTITANGGDLSIFTRYLDNSREVILGKSEPLSGLAALEMMLVGLSKDDVALSEDDWVFIHDPDLSSALVRFASNGGARQAWVDYWVEQYTDYINGQIGGLLSEADVLFIQETLRGTREDTMIGTQPATFYHGPSEADDATDNPLAESFYVVARVTQLLKERAPLKYQRFLAHTRAKLESEDGGGLYLRNFTCGTRRADWSDGVSCDNGSISYFRFGDELYDDVIAPGSEAVQSVLSSGGDLTVVADTLNNAYSTLAAAGNIHLEGDRLINKALELKRHGSLYTGRREWHNAKDAPAPGAGMVAIDVRDISVGLGEQVASVISAGGDLTLDFQEEAGNYTEERHDQEVVFDDGDYGDGGSGEPGDGGAGGDGPAPVAWDLSEDSRVIDTVNAGLRDILDHRSSLYTVVDDADHPYLIETNPLFATLDGFLGSGYLLDRLALDPDRTSRRLGDSYYETRLIRDAVLAATGRRFLDGDVDSDQQQFQRLMDNALLEAERLELAVGVALTPEQIDGLRQDMVWMEERQVDGHAVLVPVLYLAPGSSRLTAEGAVIAGDTVNVRAGGLGNSGIIAAANGLNIQAGNKGVVNLEGTLQAGTGLAIDSRGDVKNQSGTVRAGLVSIRSQGDIINESWTEQVVTEWDHGTHGRTRHGDAGLIQAADIVSLDAGGDIAVIGSRVQGDTVGLNAGGDVRIESQTLERGFDGQANGGRYQTRTTEQVASQVDATGDLLITAGRNIGITASDVSAGGNAALAAGGDVIIQSAADRDYENYHRQTRQEEKQYTHDTVRQRKAAVGAGGSLTVDAGRDLLVAGSDLASGQDMHLAAGGGIAFLATRDSEYHLAKSEKDGDYGAHSMRRDEVTRIDHVTSTATAGGDLTLTSDGDQLYQAARLESSGDTTLKSGGHITFESVKDLVQESHEKSQGDLAWQKMEGHGFTDETLRQTEIVAAGNLAIDAAEGLHIDVKQVDQQTVEQMIDGMAAENPDLAWMKDAYQRGDVDWRQVRELHDSWEYSSQGMGPAAALAVTIVVAAATAGAASAAVGGMAGATAGSGTAMAAASTGVAAGWGNAAATAMLVGAASTATTSTINNGGDLGATLDTLGSGDTLRGLAVGGLTAGLTSGLLDPAFDNMNFGKAAGIQSDSINSITRGFDLGTAQGALGFAAHSAGQGLINAGATAAIQGGSFQDHLIGNLESQGNNVLSALAFNQVGSLADRLAEGAGTGGDALGFDLFVEGGLGRTGLHALTGGAVTGLTQGDFASGAAGAGANQFLSGSLDTLSNGNAARTAAAQLAGLGGAALAGGDVEAGAWVAKQADTYNRQLHKAELKLIADHYKEYAVERGISDEQALKELLYQAQSQVDSAYAEDGGQRDLAILSGYDQQAAGDFLSGLAGHSGAISHDDGEVTAPFEATAEQYDNSYVNATHLHNIEDGAYGEELFGYPAPILTNMGSDIGAGEYLDALGQARLNAADAMFSQGATVFGGALLTPVAASIGSAATVQVPFWSGVGAQTAATGSRALGARLIVNTAAAEEGLAAAALKSNIIITDMVYGGGALTEYYVAGGSVAGFIDGVVGWTPGPPAYVPDGIPVSPFFTPIKAGQEVGATVKGALYFYTKKVGND
ncbi:DUF637 domain-containing protein [Alloalcanivorax sp. C16-1]|uniref:two-partner secretion domain-containing protein n=1 Tax=Alloalcanivorax sp. C16-1 TaxID=3390051 RepID=UPI003970F1A5